MGVRMLFYTFRVNLNENHGNLLSHGCEGKSQPLLSCVGLGKRKAFSPGSAEPRADCFPRRGETPFVAG